MPVPLALLLAVAIPLVSGMVLPANEGRTMARRDGPRTDGAQKNCPKLAATLETNRKW